MATPGGIDPELRGTDRLFAMMALLDERIVKLDKANAERMERVEDSIDELRQSMESNHASVTDRVAGLELREARRDGAVRVLLWAIPGGPAAVMLVGALVVYAGR